MKKILLLLLIVPLIFGGWMITDRVAFDRDAWIADYDQLRSATEQSYANLKWSRSSKDVDLVALHEQTLRDLEAATSNSGARRALADFIAGFKDGHFRIESGPPRPVAAVASLFKRKQTEPRIEMTMSGAEVCGALGFSQSNHELAIEGDNVKSITDRIFASGIITTPRGRRFGVIRIPLFQQREYGSVCERAWELFRSAKGGDCDDECQERFSIVAKHAVAQALADDGRALARDARDGIVIDLTGNGGGTEWAEYAAAALTAKTLQPPGVAMIRGEHWQKQLSDDPKAAAIIDSLKVRCDVRAIWHNRAAQPACWNVVVLPDSLGEPEDLKAQRPYHGPLYIMTDANTASASEQFAATLVDNGVAKTIGAKTMGVGCGFTNGGNPVKLKNSGLTVWMPDCARLRKDGSNEFEGVKPDYPVDWDTDRGQKAKQLANVLDRI